MNSNQTVLSAEERGKIIRRVSFTGITGNIVLSCFKLFAGIAGNSGAMVSDAVHSMSDVLAAFIAFIGVKLAGKSPDSEHPYGHERFESFASLVLAAILCAAGIAIGKTGLTNIFGGKYESIAVPGKIALIAAIVSIVSKEAMFRYTRHCARLLNSEAFMADAWHNRSDAFSSIGSLIGIGGSMLGVPVLDSVASIVICAFILKVAFGIGKKAISNMTDCARSKEKDDELREFILSQDGIIRIDSMRSRMFGNTAYIDLEVSMDGDKTLRETHGVAEQLHDLVESTFPDIKHIMIHVNPYS